MRTSAGRNELERGRVARNGDFLHPNAGRVVVRKHDTRNKADERNDDGELLVAREEASQPVPFGGQRHAVHDGSVVRGTKVRGIRHERQQRIVSHDSRRPNRSAVATLESLPIRTRL